MENSTKIDNEHRISVARHPSSTENILSLANLDNSVHTWISYGLYILAGLQIIGAAYLFIANPYGQIESQVFGAILITTSIGLCVLTHQSHALAKSLVHSAKEIDVDAKIIANENRTFRNKLQQLDQENRGFKHEIEDLSNQNKELKDISGQFKTTLMGIISTEKGEKISIDKVEKAANQFSKDVQEQKKQNQIRDKQLKTESELLKRREVLLEKEEAMLGSKNTTASST